MNEDILLAIAKTHNRDYITPEDIMEAFEAGHLEDLVRFLTLYHLSNKNCEDWECCAFVAVKATMKRRRDSVNEYLRQNQNHFHRLAEGDVDGAKKL